MPASCPAVLLGSGVLEAYSMRVAFQSIQRSAEEHGLGLWEYIRRGRDPTTVAVLLEDGGAVAGLGLAGGRQRNRRRRGVPLHCCIALHGICSCLDGTGGSAAGLEHTAEVLLRLCG
jgi:hypothetical protein